VGIALACIFWLSAMNAQTVNENTNATALEGVVVDAEKEALEGVNVYWLGAQMVSSTDKDGYFSIPRLEGRNHLVISYIGYDNDTLAIGDETMVEIQLSGSVEFQEIVITHKKSGLSYAYLSPIRLQEINKDELLHAACCNISESFETNATVNAAPTDAVTGTRQIKMLGLAGPYVQISRENMPDTRGLSSLQGLLYTPGSWVNAIQINTGVGAVTNGFEAITGQINIELIKPESADPFYLNVYGNEAGRKEVNVNLARKINDKWSSALLLHGLHQGRQNDRNEDGFLDNPLGRHFVALNRYKWRGKNGWEGQFGARYVNMENEAGQFGSDNGTELWRSKFSNQHLAVWSKGGKIITNTTSFGLQLAASLQDQKSSYGLRNFDARHLNFYANFIYQGVLAYSTKHRYKAGASFQLDHFDETVAATDYQRRENVVTPRFHLRYAPVESSVLRFAFGRGLRTANIFADNLGLFASNRVIQIQESEADNPYGLRPEIAWTIGTSLSQRISLGKKEIGLELDAYRTSFEDQVVIDFDASPQTVQFYNLDGKSYANNLQLALSSQIHNRVELRVAYRYSDVQLDYQEGRLEQPYTAKHRAFWNLRYEDDKGWAFNYTFNWVGPMRLPNTLSNPEDFRLPDRSPNYTLSNFQVSKTWKKIFDVYVGAENLFGFRQDQAIIDANNPFSNYFDASMVWAPIFGRNIYAGIRWRIKNKE